MRIFITGVAGSLGTHLAKELVNMGFEVAGNDIKRLEETELFDLPITYIWKSSIDLEPEDLPWIPDVVIDAAIEFADRPLANSSPITTVFGNLATAVRILELARKHFPNALLIYPSCYDEATEVLTRDGWKNMWELSENDEIASLNPETFEVEYLKPVQIIRTYYEGPMYWFTGKSIDLLVTPNHNVFAKTSRTWKLLTAEELAKHAAFEFKTDGLWRGIHQPYVIIPRAEGFGKKMKPELYVKALELREKGYTYKEIADVLGVSINTVEWWFSKSREKKRLPVWAKSAEDRAVRTEDFLEFLGYVVTDGHIRRDDYVIEVGQKKVENIDKIEKVFINIARQLGVDYNRYEREDKEFGGRVISFHIRDFGLWSFLVNEVGRLKCEKRIPRWVFQLDKDYLKVLFDSMMRGDGARRGDVLITCSKYLADDMMELALKVGYSASISIMKPGRKALTQSGREIIQKAPVYYVNIRRERTTPYMRPTKDVEIIQYSGWIWDVTLPRNHILYVRRNGKPVWSGNSFNSIYGWQYIGWARAQEVLNKTGMLLPLPTSVYGWSKASAELLYFSYAIMHKLRVLITRIGSSYGPGGRLDVLPHKLIVYSIRGLRFKLRSPRATRLWTYVKDAVDFYRELFNEHIYDYEPASPAIITNAGNAGYMDSSKPNYITTNEEIAQLIKRIAREFGRDLDYEPIDYYEPGEYTPVSMYLDYVDKPIKIDIDVTSMQPTWWKPKYTLYDGLKETYNYFLTIFGKSGERGKQ